MTIDLELATNNDILAELRKRETKSNAVFFVGDEVGGLFVGNGVNVETLATLGLTLVQLAAYQNAVDALKDKLNDDDEEDEAD